MKIARYREKAGVEGLFGIIEGDSVYPIVGSPFDDQIKKGASKLALSDVVLLAPCVPSKIVAGGANYHGHVREMNLKMPDVPVFFLKPPTSVVGSDEAVQYPPESSRVEYEAELAVVIKKKMHRTAPENIRKNILGYTCVNDVTARDIQAWGGSLLHLCHSKSFDTFCPTGPWIETDIDPNNVDITLKVNGEVRQRTNTNDMIFTVEKMVSYFSHVMTLMPGDLVLTGTPAGVGKLEIDDVAELTIEGIGTLRNRVIKAAL